MMVQEFGQQNPEVILLLHGGGLSWWDHRETALLLAEQYHVVLPVLDGHADSGVPFTSIGDNAARLLDWLDKRFGGRVTAISGLSLGAQVALEMLAQRPEVCRFALIESAQVKPDRLTHALIGPAFGMSYGLIHQRWFAKLQAAYLGIPKSLFADYFRDTCKLQKSDMIAFLKASCTYTIKPGLSGTTAKVLIAAGSRELGSIRASAKLLHRAIPDSRLALLPGLRHGDLCINHPARYAQILTDWIRRNEYDPA